MYDDLPGHKAVDNLASIRGPWGLFATLGFACVVMVAFFAAQTVAALVTLFLETGSFSVSAEQAKNLDGNGMVISTATLGAFFVCVPLICLLIIIRRGPSLRDYLALGSPAWKPTLQWSAIFFVLIVAVEILNVVLDKPAVPDFMKAAFASVPHPAWLFFAVALAAPIFEEVFFRGFVLEGLRGSRLGETGTVLFTAATWAIIHLQYGWYEISIIFVMGIVLGWARLRTNSLWVPIALHALNNTVAMIQVALLSANNAG